MSSKRLLQQAAGLARDFLRTKKIALSHSDALELVSRLQGKRHLHHAQQDIKASAFHVLRSLRHSDAQGMPLYWQGEGWGPIETAQHFARPSLQGQSGPPKDEPAQWVHASSHVQNRKVRCEEPWDPDCEDFVAATPIWLTCLPFSVNITRHDDAINISVHPYKNEDETLDQLTVELGRRPAANSGVLVCANCSFVGAEDDLPLGKDLAERHAPGDTYSDRECPHCGALCFPFKDFSDAHLHGKLSWDEMSAIAGPLTGEGKAEAARLTREVFAAPVTYIGDSLFSIGPESVPALFNPKVTAETHDDDWVYSVPSFDATPWFAQASDKELAALIACDFGGDYGADAVAEFFDGRHKAITEMFAHKKQGFECHVNREEALRWLRAHRPHLLKNASRPTLQFKSKLRVPKVWETLLAIEDFEQLASLPPKSHHTLPEPDARDASGNVRADYPHPLRDDQRVVSFKEEGYTVSLELSSGSSNYWTKVRVITPTGEVLEPDEVSFDLSDADSVEGDIAYRWGLELI